jgi:hypothetical protein
MTKQTGLAAAFYVGGSDLSGDTSSLGRVSGSVAVIDSTDITQSAVSRLFGLRDGGIDFTSYFDPATSHPVLSALPTTDVVMTFCVPPLAIGSPAASLNAKQINYDGTRGTDGSFTFAVSGQGQGYGLEWGSALTAGMRTDTSATGGTAYDNGAGYAYGAQAYLQAASFSGTDVTVNVTHCTTSGGSYTTLMSFSQITGSTPLSQRISVANNTTVHEFLKVSTTTSGGFSSLVFAVMINVNTTAGVVF